MQLSSKRAACVTRCLCAEAPHSNQQESRLQAWATLLSAHMLGNLISDPARRCGGSSACSLCNTNSNLRPRTEHGLHSHLLDPGITLPVIGYMSTQTIFSFTQKCFAACAATHFHEVHWFLGVPNRDAAKPYLHGVHWFLGVPSIDGAIPDLHGAHQFLGVPSINAAVPYLHEMHRLLGVPDVDAAA
eukprot:1159776-Pelagomonas_calceolata.AAC.7